MTRNSFFRQQQGPARFKPGDRVRTVNIHPQGHTRLPRYARDKVGTVELIHGCHAYPDSVASGRGDDPQWLYTVVFDGREIWGAGRRPDLEDLDRRLRALSRAGMMDAHADHPRPRHAARRRRAGVPRAVGGAGLRHGARAARARPVHLAANGRRRSPTRSSGHRRRAIPTPARPTTGTGSMPSSGWLPKRASPTSDAGALSATPGTTPPTARRTARRSSCGRKISARP